ncbi:MAG: type II toxin-antitoxin system PemK/MazF family toxin [Actinomycetota bacterium]
MRRGELYWAKLPPPVGRRPVLIVTRSSVLGVRTSVTVAPVTRTIRSIPSELPLDRAHGLRVVSVANCDTLQTIPRALLGPRPIGRLSLLELIELDTALRYSLGITS